MDNVNSGTRHRLWRAWAIVLAMVVVLAPATAAHAGFDPPAGDGSSASDGSAPSGSDSGGASGQPVQKTVRTCSLYATSANFGLSCLGGGDGPAGPTVQEILGKTDGKPNPAPTCWDTRIGDEELVTIYHYTQNPLAPYYLHSCITGLQLDKPLADQPTVRLNQIVIEIPIDAGKCDTTKPFVATDTGLCIMTLIQNQQQVVTVGGQKNGQIPGITVSTEPSTRVRTNEDVAYVDAATDSDGHRITRTPNYEVGGVTLWATMTDYRIYPYGPDGVSRSCDGTQAVGPGDTRASKPNACWFSYPRSSADQPRHVYPFRAEADWTVYYSTGGATQVLASFQKYDDLMLPVSDIQTIVVN